MLRKNDSLRFLHGGGRNYSGGVERNFGDRLLVFFGIPPVRLVS